MLPRRLLALSTWLVALSAPALLAQTGVAPFGAGASRPGPGVTMPVAIERPTPDYPHDGPAAHAAGTVVIEVVVRRDGTVGEARVVNDSTSSQWPMLVEAAMDAARRWRFKPGERAGVAADVIVPIAFTFNLASPSGANQFAVVYPDGVPGLLPPRPTHSQPPAYTEPAMRAKIQGDVLLAVVVDSTGTVTSVRVARSLDKQFGLDDQAVAAAKQWTFEPGRLNGTPVMCQVALVLNFKLH